MPRHTEPEDDAEDWDDVEPDDEAGKNDDDTIPCPHCRRPIYEDAERCPHCERYLSREDAPAGRKPVWIIVGAAAAIVVVYIWIMYNR